MGRDMRAPRRSVTPGEWERPCPGLDAHVALARVRLSGTLVDADGENPVGSIFVIDAKDRAAVDFLHR